MSIGICAKTIPLQLLKVHQLLAWLMAHPEHAEFDMRFDAILIAPKHLPKHLMAAFDAGS